MDNLLLSGNVFDENHHEWDFLGKAWGAMAGIDGEPGKGQWAVCTLRDLFGGRCPPYGYSNIRGRGDTLPGFQTCPAGKPTG